MNCEEIIEKQEICLGHITKKCPECKFNEKNKGCYWDNQKKYNPIVLRTFYVNEK
jgi:hypothetical protein